ncbi:hypothetical protein SLA2020_411190 [Shorea laevis]
MGHGIWEAKLVLCALQIARHASGGFGDEDRDRRQQERGERAVIILWNCMHCTSFTRKSALPFSTSF